MLTHDKIALPEKLTPKEEAAMKAIWLAGEGNIQSFLDVMPPPSPPYTTLASTVKNLEKKHFVRGKLIGKVYLYSAIVSEETYKGDSIRAVVQDFFGQSYTDMLRFLLQNKEITEGDLKEVVATSSL